MGIPEWALWYAATKFNYWLAPNRQAAWLTKTIRQMNRTIERIWRSRFLDFPPWNNMLRGGGGIPGFPSKYPPSMLVYLWTCPPCSCPGGRPPSCRRWSPASWTRRILARPWRGGSSAGRSPWCCTSGPRAAPDIEYTVYFRSTYSTCLRISGPCAASPLANLANKKWCPSPSLVLLISKQQLFMYFRFTCSTWHMKNEVHFWFREHQLINKQKLYFRFKHKFDELVPGIWMGWPEWVHPRAPLLQTRQPLYPEVKTNHLYFENAQDPNECTCMALGRWSGSLWVQLYLEYQDPSGVILLGGSSTS